MALNLMEAMSLRASGWTFEMLAARYEVSVNAVQTAIADEVSRIPTRFEHIVIALNVLAGSLSTLTSRIGITFFSILPVAINLTPTLLIAAQLTPVMVIVQNNGPRKLFMGGPSVTITTGWMLEAGVSTPPLLLPVNKEIWAVRDGASGAACTAIVMGV